jgi:DUF438 domain-containing protein
MRGGERMSIEIVEKVLLETQVCAECGVTFALPARVVSERRKTGNNFYCPNGHSLFFGKSENDRLKEQVSRLEQRLSAKNSEIEMLEQSKRKVETKLKKTEKRIAAGVCPCCSRTFQNVQRHIKSKHPDFAEA